jgi:uncharacterized protein
MAPKKFRIDAAILKISSRCNINCTYCYMYNLADQSWKKQPGRMDMRTLETFFERLAEYLVEQKQSEFHVSLHGGEPLLAGATYVRNLADLRDACEQRANAKISLSMQTNGLLLDQRWLSLFSERNIFFGVSCDGPREYHDKSRVDKKGKGTHSAVESLIKRLVTPKKASSFSGVLSVLDAETDGGRIVEYFYGLGVRSIDLLLPDQNHDFPLPEYANSNTGIFGKILWDAYLRWRAIDDEQFKIRIFDQIMGGLIGIPPSIDSLGTNQLSLITIETSGEIQPVDSFKCCGEKFTATGRYLWDSRLSELSETPIGALQALKPAPSACNGCDFYSTCGGGYLPHRMKDGTFNHPTIYCEDLKFLCRNIERHMRDEIRAVASN